MSILNLLGGGEKIVAQPQSSFWIHFTTYYGSRWYHRNIRVKDGILDHSTLIQLLSGTTPRRILGYNNSKTVVFTDRTTLAVFSYLPGTPYSSFLGDAPSSGYSALSMDMSPANNLIAAGFNNASGYGFLLYPWSDAGGFGPRILPASAHRAKGPVYGVKFSPTGGAVVISDLGVVPRTRAFRLDSSGGIIGEYPKPTEIVTIAPDSYAFSPGGDILYIYGSHGFAAYRWSDGTGFGEMLFTGGDIPTSSTIGEKRFFVTSDGGRVVMSHDQTPFVIHRRWSTMSGDGGAQPVPSELFPGTSRDIAISPNEDFVLRAVLKTPGTGELEMYRWSNQNGFGSLVPYSEGIDPFIFAGIRQVFVHP